MKAIFEVESFFCVTIRKRIYLKGTIKEGEIYNGMVIKNSALKGIDIKEFEIATSFKLSSVCLSIEKTNESYDLVSKLNFPLLLEF